jgi:hypothetical protein
LPEQPFRPPDFSILASRLDELRQQLASRTPDALTANAGCAYHALSASAGEFRLAYMGQPLQLSYPGGVATDIAGIALPDFLEALLLYYFSHADGAPRLGHWISFGELPDGRFYNQAFQGYTGAVIARRFHDNLAAFAEAARRLGGCPPQSTPALPAPGDLAFEFHALPALYLLVAYWAGDEELPASCQVLFEASAPHYLPTDACAILGSQLTRQLVK